MHSSHCGRSNMSFNSTLVDLSARPTYLNPFLVQGIENWCHSHVVEATNTKKVPSTWPRPSRGGRFPKMQCHSNNPILLRRDDSDSSSGLCRWKSYCGLESVAQQPGVLANNNSMSDVSLHGSHESEEHQTIKDVWGYNLEAEFAEIRYLLPHYRYIAMDTEFPGVVIRNAPYYRNIEGNQLETIRQNVDVLKLIQLGISFFDQNGRSPPGTSTWQFNFKFNKNQDRSAQSSIDLLQEAGMQFERHEEEGIDPEDFCYLFFSSGLVLQEDIFWLTYHGGYDFGYLMRMLRGQNLPSDPEEFSEFMRTYFPTCYDVKVILAGHPSFVGGLHDIAVRLGLKRIGSPHQAGSDSLLTGKAFFKIKEKFFEDGGEDSVLEKYNGKIYGFEHKLDECFTFPQNQGPEYEFFQPLPCQDGESNHDNLLCTDSYSFPLHFQKVSDSSAVGMNV